MLNKRKLILLGIVGTFVCGGVAVGLLVRALNQPSSIAVEMNTESSAEKSKENTENASGEENSEEAKDTSADSASSQEVSNGTNVLENTSENTPEDQPGHLPASSAFGNCTMGYGTLMLINPVFTVTTDYISRRRTELIDLASTYGVNELHSYNGRPMLDSEAGAHLNEMFAAYSAENPGHSLSTVSCFRSVGTACGRLCYATGTSDHHTGYTCDLIDASYGSELNTDDYPSHLDWQWLHANSYKYGFIDRFIYDFAGGPMTEPVNITEDGTTGLYETWHYRYVGVPAATEIAQGKYNQGRYDSLEHYLKATGRVTSLTAGRCD